MLFFPALAGLVVGLLRKLELGNRWHGPPDVILSAHSSKEKLSIKSGFIASFSAIISISAGGSVGQYGPLVHFGATIGANIKSFFKSVGDYQVYLGAGVAAAISSGFGAPIAGLIFSREVILRHQSLASFAPILVSSIIAYLISKFFFGIDSILATDIGEISSIKEFPALVITGIVAGLISVLYMNGLTHKNFFPKITFLKLHYQPILAALICSIVGIFIPEAIGLGTETIKNLLLAKISWENAILFLVTKLLLTVICIRLGLVGGVFAPALFLGACTGLAMGVLIKLFLPETNIILYTVSAMAAIGSCVIGGPVANMMIIFELTKDYQATIAAGISIVFASLISFRLIGQSVFDKVLLNRDFDLKIGRDHLLLKEKKIKEIVQNKYCKILGDLSISEVIKKMVVTNYSEAYLVNKNGKLINKFELTKLLREKNQKKKVLNLKKNQFLKIPDENDILSTIKICENFIGESIPIIDKNSKLVGVVSESDMFKIFLKTSEMVHKIEAKD